MEFLVPRRSRNAALVGRLGVHRGPIPYPLRLFEEVGACRVEVLEDLQAVPVPSPVRVGQQQADILRRQGVMPNYPDE